MRALPAGAGPTSQSTGFKLPLGGRSALRPSRARQPLLSPPVRPVDERNSGTSSSSPSSLLRADCHAGAPQPSAFRLAHRSVYRGWAWAPAWLPPGVGPLFGISGILRRPVIVALSVGA
eukprot:7572414-Alexandrium_andersonii.AAC.1